jgi:ketosteroid isomerase-like protein
VHPNAELIERFYQAFQRRDAAAMVACYHPDVEFWDPVFLSLKGSRAGDMWRMLCERGKDLTIAYRDVRADDGGGSAHWDADYTYSGSGRKVHNSIDARFEFRDGLIVRHTDTFDLHRWASQALGPLGMLLGWLPPFQSALRKKAATALERFAARSG